MTARELERIRNAFHEAGHAVVALAAGRRVAGVSVGGALTGAAMCAHTEGDGSLEALRADLRIAVAGQEGAERIGAWTPPPKRPVTDDDIYFTSTELRLADRAATIAAQRQQATGDGAPTDAAPRIATDDEAAAELARQIDPADPDAEIALQRELAGRTLDVRCDLHRALAEALHAWGSLSEGEILAIVNTGQE